MKFLFLVNDLSVGGDQNHGGILKAIEWCKQNGKEVVTLDRTPNISSTEIREKLKNRIDYGTKI